MCLFFAIKWLLIDCFKLSKKNDKKGEIPMKTSRAVSLFLDFLEEENRQDISASNDIND